MLLETTWLGLKMRRLTIEDVQKATRLLNVPLSEERLQTITTSLNQVVEILKPLTQWHLQKELEPTTYLAYISGRLKIREDV